MDSDGGWSRRELKNGGYSVSANYACSSDEFIKSLQEVLLTKGWEVKNTHHITDLNGKLFSGNRLYVPVRHAKKLAKWIYSNTTPEIRCSRKFVTAAQEVLRPC